MKKYDTKHCCENCKHLFMETKPLSVTTRVLIILEYCNLLKIQLKNSEKTICDKFDIQIKPKDEIQEIKEKYNFRTIE